MIERNYRSSGPYEPWRSITARLQQFFAGASMRYSFLPLIQETTIDLEVAESIVTGDYADLGRAPET
jgi:hypothetical protein